MILRGFTTLLLLCFTLIAHAAPKDLSLFFDPAIGFVSLSDGSYIEGSKEFGGRTPDFLIDWNAKEFSELKKFCQKVKLEKKDPMTAVREIRRYLNQHIFIHDASTETYTSIIASHKKDNLALLSEFMRSKSGSCRENAYILHLALKEAGVMNKLAYIKIPMIISNSNDHAIIVYRQGGVWRSVDAASDAYNDSPLDTLLSQGKISQLNLFPQVWLPKQNEFLFKIKKFKSEQEFKDTLISIIKRIPDMKEVWEASEKYHLQLKIGGGVVRGAIRWMVESLGQVSVSELGRLTPPKSTELLLNPKADRDLFAPKSKLAGAMVLSALKTWEISDDTAFQESISAGGGALDKVRVGVDGVDDPLGALGALFSGELKYVIKSDEELKKTFWFKERNNTKTAMALRFIRVTLDFPELVISKEVQDYFRSVALSENISNQKNSQEFHWIQKALKKIFEASFDDSVTTVTQLKKYGFLKPLAQAGYELTLDSAIVPSFEGLEGLGWSISDIEAAKKLFNTSFDSMLSISEAALRATNYEATLKILRRGVAFAKSAEDFVQLYSAKIKGLLFHEQAKEEVFVESLDSFLKFKPSIDLAVKYMRLVQVSDDADKKLYAKMVKLTHHSDEFIQLFQPIFDSKSHSFARAFICEENLDSFFKFKPSAAQIRALLWIGKFPDESRVDFEILKRAAILMSSASEYIEVLKPFPEFNSEVFQRYRSEAALISIRHFFNLKPTTDEVKRLLALGKFDDKVDQEIFFRAEPLFKDRAEYDALLAQYPKVAKPTWTDRCWRKLVGR